MKILIDTENKTITVMEKVNIGELFKYLESHFTDTKPFSNGWRDYELILTPIWDGTIGETSSPTPAWDPYRTPAINPFNTPATTNPFNPFITTTTTPYATNITTYTSTETSTAASTPF